MRAFLVERKAVALIYAELSGVGDETVRRDPLEELGVRGRPLGGRAACLFPAREQGDSRHRSAKMIQQRRFSRDDSARRRGKLYFK